MQHLSTAFLIIALAIVVNDGNATSQNKNQTNQLAEEGKNKAVIIVEGPKYVNQLQANRPLNANHTHKPDQRPPSKSPIRTTFNNQKNSFRTPQQYYGQRTRVPAQNPYPISPHLLHPTTNSVLKFPRVIPLPPGHHYYSSQFRTPLMFAASTGKSFVVKSPKFSLPVQTINGIRSDFVRPPKEFNFTTTTIITTTPPTTTTRLLRTKRIWPKRILEKMNSTALFTSMMLNKTDTNTITNITNHEASAKTHIRVRFVNNTNNETETTTAQPITRGNRRFTRAPKKKLTTPSLNLDALKPDDWVPIIPSHYPKHKHRSRITISKRSDVFYPDPKTTHTPKKQTLFVHSYGLLPVTASAQSLATGMEKKKMIFFKKRRQLNPYLYSAYSSKGLQSPPQYIVEDLQTDHSNYLPKFVTKVKHHHHHHHHRYIKTVEKPYKVEVLKPYPVPIKVPHPIPVKVVEKEYVPRSYPIIHHVPVLKQVEVRVPVEKKVPYPVRVTVPVDRPVPVEKKVPYPVPVKVLVPQPYPVERKVPYPVEVKVKEPVEVIKHVPVKVPQPYPVKVPVTVEKKVPYPVEVEKRVPVYVHKPYPVEKKVPYPVKVTVPVDRPVPVEKKVPYPVPVKVLVPQPYPVERKVPYPVEVKVKEPVEVIKHIPVKVLHPYPVKVPVTVEKKVPYPVEVEKRVPVYVHKPYPVEKKVPYPVRVPYPVKVPVKVPVYILHPMPIFSHDHYFVSGGKNYVSNTARSDEKATNAPQHTVTVHGNSGFTGFQTRSDNPASTTSTELP